MIVDIFYNFIAVLTLLLIITAIPINLKFFQGLYIVAVASNIFLSYVYLAQYTYIYAIVFGILGEITLILLTGIFGNKWDTNKYQAFTTVVGLFPWSFNLSTMIIFVLFFFIITTGYSTIKKRKVLVSMGISRGSKISSLNKKQLEEYRNKNKIVISLPILISVVVSFVLALVL